MRIISQDGTIDFDYSNISLVVSGGCIEAVPIADQETVVIAEYSTPEKAQKALERLHSAYKSMHSVKSKDGITHYNPPKVWKFPDEAEA